MSTPFPVARPTSNAAIVSLIFGLLSWLILPLIGALVAIIAGHVARGDIKRANGQLEGDGMAIAGLVLGYLQFVLCILAVVVVFLFLGGIAFLASMAGH
ncbi:MAG: DUF4190 domain-containing protein [Lysobacterales bacterium]